MYEFFVEQILIYQNAIYLALQHMVAAAHAMLYGNQPGQNLAGLRRFIEEG